MKKIISQINEEGKRFQTQSDEELTSEIEKIQNQLQKAKKKKTRKEEEEERNPQLTPIEYQLPTSGYSSYSSYSSYSDYSSNKEIGLGRFSEVESVYESRKKEEELFFSERERQSLTDELTKILIPWFGIVQEMSSRTLGLRHYNTQLEAGLLLHQGKIVEMKTGEGKTLASTLPVSLHALGQEGVHVVTVNDYLAERDQQWMGKLYTKLGLSVGLVKNTSPFSKKKESYFQDLTYVTNSELVFDYLRDCSASTKEEIVQRPFSFCIIDEIDSILIDEARTPLILSTSRGKKSLTKLSLAKTIAQSLERTNDFEIDEKRRDIHLTEIGYRKTIEKLGKKTLYESTDPWMLEILNALKAEHLFKKNKDYIVLENKVVIVDEFTGRIMDDRRWGMGIHEAIERKENVILGGETKTKSSITYQNFFTLYPKVAGMTGTAKTTEKEFQDIYNLPVVVLDTYKKMLRQDLPDLIYQNEFAKWKAVVQQAKVCAEIGQPLLIGTVSVEKSELVSELFQVEGLKHQVLNAKPENVNRESEIIAQAGKKGAITIATNMAGRGTDIILGGNPTFEIKQLLLTMLSSFLKQEKKDTISIQTRSKKQQCINQILADCEINSENCQTTTTTYQEQEQELFDLLEEVEEKYRLKSQELQKELDSLPYGLEQVDSSLQKIYHFLFPLISNQWKKENEEVKKVGGLFVLGTERHETRRIDNQLRGRSGRQGDPGISQFFVSLEDSLLEIFGGENLRKWVTYLLDDNEIPLDSNLLTKSLENAQEKVESYNYEIRKNVFEYDSLLNQQRKQIFEARRELFERNFYHHCYCQAGETTLDELKEKKGKGTFFTTNNNEKNEKNENENQNQENPTIDLLFGTYSSYFLRKNDTQKTYEEIWITNDLRCQKENTYLFGFLKQKEISQFLNSFDWYWAEHMEDMNSIRETINWRAYGQQNPLMEYNMQGTNSFSYLFEKLRISLLY